MEKDKEKIYILLGALKFQKLVFVIEKLKYKILGKFPKFVKLNEKLIDISYNKRLKRTTTEEEKNIIKEQCLKEKLYLRKEINTKQNRNYHYDENNPLSFINYLKFNKNIHIKSLKNNIITITIFITINILFPNLLSHELFIFFISSQLFFSFINFQCINLQNYNLERFNNKRIQELLLRKEKNNQARNLKKYSNCSKKVSNLMKESSEIPSIEDIRNCVENREEKEELLNFALKQRARIAKKEELLEKRKKLTKIKAILENEDMSCNFSQYNGIIRPINEKQQDIILKKERKIK
jgi:hypothetical protein